MTRARLTRLMNAVSDDEVEKASPLELASAVYARIEAKHNKLLEKFREDLELEKELRAKAEQRKIEAHPDARERALEAIARRRAERYRP